MVSVVILVVILLDKIVDPLDRIMIPGGDLLMIPPVSRNMSSFLNASLVLS
jgi:hypothetical protein